MADRRECCAVGLTTQKWPRARGSRGQATSSHPWVLSLTPGHFKPQACGRHPEQHRTQLTCVSVADHRGDGEEHSRSWDGNPAALECTAMAGPHRWC